MKKVTIGLGYIVIGFSAIYFNVGCSAVKYTATLSKQPKSEYYSLSKDTSYQLGSIDTSVIYVCEQDLIANGDFGAKPVHLYSFMKFAGKGIVFYSDYDEKPFTESSAVAKSGQFCHYKVNKDELELEYYSHLLKKFTIMYGKISAERIIFYEDRVRTLWGGRDKLQILYLKSTVRYNRVLSWPE